MNQKAYSRAAATHENHRINRKEVNIKWLYTVIFVLSLCCGSAGASETAFYIDSCQTTISQPGTYVLRSNLSRSATGGFCISIEADNVTLDGDGHSVTGPYHAAGTGILVHNPSSAVSNVKLKNLTVSRWMQAILLKNVKGGEIINNTISDNGLYVGIFLEGTTEILIKDNILEKNHGAIYLLGSNANIISNNTLIANPLGIENNYASNGNLIVNNNFYQGRTERAGTVNLTEGWHEVFIGWYEGGGGANMELKYGQGAGIAYGALTFANPTNEPTIVQVDDLRVTCTE